MANNLPDSINPENDPIVDGMRRDGEFLRDVAEGKTASEIAFDTEMGTAERRAFEHDSIMEDLGQVIAASTPPPDTSATFEEIPEISTSTATPEVAKPNLRRQAVQQRAMERRPPTLQQTQRLMGEHGKLFVDVGQIQADAEPPAFDGEMPPDVAARIAHPGKEKNEELAGVFAEYIEADKARWESLYDLLALQIDFAIQARYELDQLRQRLEGGRI